MLHAMFSGRFDTKPSEDGSYFIDRDGTHFRYILNYLRTGELIVPDDKIVRRELLAEAKFYQVEGMINELEPKSPAGPVPFKDSVILSSDQGQTLINWLKNTPGLTTSEKLLYRASRNGWAANNFHSCCDNKGPTVTVIKSGNYIFGGYIEQYWEGGKVTGCLHVQKVVIFFQYNAQLNAMQCSLRASCPVGGGWGSSPLSRPLPARELARWLNAMQFFILSLLDPPRSYSHLPIQTELKLKLTHEHLQKELDTRNNEF